MKRISYLEARRLFQQGRRRHKYRAKPVRYNGHYFASTGEARRYIDLRALEESGEISDLRIQVAFVVRDAAGVIVIRYVADFVYRGGDGRSIVEDFKGTRTAEYRRKKRHIERVHGIKIFETDQSILSPLSKAVLERAMTAANDAISHRSGKR